MAHPSSWRGATTKPSAFSTDPIQTYSPHDSSQQMYEVPSPRRAAHLLVYEVLVTTGSLRRPSEMVLVDAPTNHEMAHCHSQPSLAQTLAGSYLSCISSTAGKKPQSAPGGSPIDKETRWEKQHKHCPRHLISLTFVLGDILSSRSDNGSENNPIVIILNIHHHAPWTGWLPSRRELNGALGAPLRVRRDFGGTSMICRYDIRSCLQTWTVRYLYPCW